VEADHMKIPVKDVSGASTIVRQRGDSENGRRQSISSKRVDRTFKRL
jgi:hypothetical protein